MKSNIITQTSIMRLTVLLNLTLLFPIPLSGQIQNDSTDYRDFSRLPFVTLELERIAKTQVAGEYWYYDAQNCAEEKDQLYLKAATADAKTIEWMEKFKLQEQKTEEVQPKWWQHPITITIIATVAFVAGVGIATAL